MFSPLEQFDAISLTNNYIQLPFLSTVLPFVLIIFLAFCLVNLLKFNLKLIPTAIQRVVELLVEFIFNLIKQQIGKDGYMFFPFILTLFNFVLIANLLSLIPFGIALTSHIIMIM